MSAVEEWRPVAGFPDYRVSSLGRVSSHKKHRRSRILRPGGTRYLVVQLYRDNVTYPQSVHRLVVEAFRGPILPGQVVRHLDGNPLNNQVDNLTAGTPSENQRDSVRHGTHHESRRARCDGGHLFDERNTYIRRGGYRDCRKCKANRERARYHRRAFLAAGIEEAS